MFGGAKLRVEILQREPCAVARPTRGGALRRRWASWRLWRRTRRGWRGCGCAWSCCAGASPARRPPRWRRSARWTEPAGRKNSNTARHGAPSKFESKVLFFWRGEEVKYLWPGDEDGDLVQGPQHRLGAGRRGQAAGVAIVLTQVALRQEAHQREGLDFNHLSCGRWMWRGAV